MHQPHEYALLFPPMAADQYEDLKRDIAENGLMDAITLLDGKVLDGWNRERACNDTGEEPHYEDYKGSDPLLFVVTRNLMRRHLTFEQRMDLGRRLLPHYQEQSKVDQLNGRAKGTLPSQEGKVRHNGEATARAGAAVGVSRASITRAKNVHEKDPALYQEVLDGKVQGGIAAADRKVNGKPPDLPEYRSYRKPEPKGTTQAPRPKRGKNPNGKTNPTRQRELKAQKKTGNFGDLIHAQLKMNELCSWLESFDISNYEFDSPTLLVIADVHDDLLSLQGWLDRALLHIGGHLADHDVREKIKRMRDPHGRTPEEAMTANRLADRLERKLEARLESPPSLRVV